MLSDGRETLLRHGMYFPFGIAEEAAHHEVAHWLLGTLPKLRLGWSPLNPTLDGMKMYLRYVTSEARSQGAHTLILSSEVMAALAATQWRTLLGLLQEAGAGTVRVTFSDFNPAERLESHVSQYVVAGEFVDERARRTIDLRTYRLRCAMLEAFRTLSSEQDLIIQALEYSKDAHYMSDLVRSITNDEVERELRETFDRAYNRSWNDEDLSILNEFNRLNTEEREFDAEAPITFSYESFWAQRRLHMVRHLVLERRQLIDEVELARRLLVEAQHREAGLSRGQGDPDIDSRARTFPAFRGRKIGKRWTPRRLLGEET